jgi:hypothetical protein
MQISKVQAELILQNLRERMSVRQRKFDGVYYSRSSVKLTPTELVAFDVALNSLKLNKLEMAEKIVNDKIEKLANTPGKPE